MPHKQNPKKNSRAESNRKTERLAAYLSDGIRGRVYFENESFPVSLLDISPFGVGVTPDSDLPKRIENALVPGAMVQFQYTSRNTSNGKFKALVAHSTKKTIQGESRFTFGLSFLNNESTASRAHRRKTERFECSEFFRPHALCGSPFFFGERAFFSVLDISSSGCAALTSARNKFLSPNMEVSLAISFPLVGTINVDAVVRAVSLKNKGSRYQVNLEFKQTTQAMLQAIGEYLILVNPGIQPEELRRAGLRLSKLTNIISLSSPNSHEDWDSVLNLRQNVMPADGSSSSSLFDKFDSFSRNLMVKVGDRVVGNGRILFLNNATTRSEAFSSFSMESVAEVIDSNTLEVSFPVIDPSFNRNETFETLFKGYFKIAFENDANTLLCAAPASEAASITALGFTEIGKTVRSKFRNTETVMQLYSLNLAPLKLGQPTGAMTPQKLEALIIPVLELCGIRPCKPRTTELSETNSGTSS